MSDDSDPLLERQSQLPDAVVDDEIVDTNEDEARRYPQRKRTGPKHLEDYVAETDINLAASANDSVDYCYRVANIPHSYAQANGSFEADKWHCAMNEEITALHDNNTFEITPLPEGRTVVGRRWVYAVKLGPNGEEKYKTRFMLHCVNVVAAYGKADTCSPRHVKTCFSMRSGYSALWFEVSEIRCVRSEWILRFRLIQKIGVALLYMVLSCVAMVL